MSDTCPACFGRGEYEVNRGQQPGHTKYPNPLWEPWEPETQTCIACGGTGLRATRDTNQETS